MLNIGIQIVGFWDSFDSRPIWIRLMWSIFVDDLWHVYVVLKQGMASWQLSIIAVIDQILSYRSVLQSGR